MDYEKAFALFEKSGEAGNMNACNNLAFMYAYGHGVSETCLKLKTFSVCSPTRKSSGSIGAWYPLSFGSWGAA